MNLEIYKVFKITINQDDKRLACTSCKQWRVNCMCNHCFSLSIQDSYFMVYLLAVMYASYTISVIGDTSVQQYMHNLQVVDLWLANDWHICICIFIIVSLSLSIVNLYSTESWRISAALNKFVINSYLICRHWLHDGTCPRLLYVACGLL